MARSILSAGFPIAFVLLFLAFDSSFGQRSPKIHPSLRGNTSTAAEPEDILDVGTSAGTPASSGVSRQIWANAGANAGVNTGTGGPSLTNNYLGQAGAGVGSAIGAGVGGLVGSAANLVLSPLAIIRPLFGGNNNNVIQPVASPPPPPPHHHHHYPEYQAPAPIGVPPPVPYYPVATPSNNVGMVGWGSYGANSGTLSYNQCNALWKQAILNEAMNYDDWKCSIRLTTANAVQACVLTGAIGTSATPPVITTGCGWTMPLFCDDSINDIVYSLRATSPTPAPVAPAGYTYVAGSGTYKVHTEVLTWDAARAACAAEGAHLAVPSTANDYTVLQNLFNAALTSSNNGGWVGINDITTEGYYQTVTGQPLCTLQSYWALNEPDNGVNAGNVEQDCIQFGLAASPTLTDNACSTTLPFVCEITLPTRLATCRSSTTG